MPRLDTGLQEWLETLAAKWELLPDLVATHVGRTEIANRLTTYPKISSHLRADAIDWATVFPLLRRCWALGGRFDSIRFNEFVDRGSVSIDALNALLHDATENPVNAVEGFIEKAAALGYVNRSRGAADRPGACLLASVLLTCFKPDRFVDYRRYRWEHFANELRYPLPDSSAREGTWVVWAGEFATEVSRTGVFRQLWGEEAPLWTVAGVCWDARDPEPPLADPPDPSDAGPFAEGEMKRRLHLIRERSSGVVRTAKEHRARTDPGLCCEACGFSYTEFYGERGAGFIEAHHIVPLWKLHKGSRTRVEDLALLCANCHRMIHRDPMLTVQELRDLLAETRERQANNGIHRARSACR